MKVQSLHMEKKKQTDILRKNGKKKGQFHEPIQCYFTSVIDVP